jgi:hypothetical protein
MKKKIFLKKNLSWQVEICWIEKLVENAKDSDQPSAIPRETILRK